MTRRVFRWTQSCPRTGGVLYAGAHDSTGPAGQVLSSQVLYNSGTTLGYSHDNSHGFTAMRCAAKRAASRSNSARKCAGQDVSGAASKTMSMATSDRFCPLVRRPTVLLVPIVISAFKPIVRSSSSVCNGNYLDTLAEHTVDDEERNRRSRKRLMLPGRAAFARRRGLALRRAKTANRAERESGGDAGRGPKCEEVARNRRPLAASVLPER